MSASDPERWLREHGDALFRFAVRRLRDPDLAEDAVQEALLAALERRESFRGQSSERTWLIGILRHKVLDILRRAARDAAAAGGEPDVLAATFEHGFWRERPSRWPGDPALSVEREEFLAVLEECIRRLPPRTARAFCLREFDDLPSDRVCEVLEVTATNLWTLLHRARVQLRRCLDENWFRSGRSREGP